MVEVTGIEPVSVDATDMTTTSVVPIKSFAINLCGNSRFTASLQLKFRNWHLNAHTNAS